MSEGEEVEKLYTIREVARLLDLSYITVWSWIRKGKIRAVKVDGRVRIPEGELRKLVRGLSGR
jgi:excisionase family DNA binding protein